VVLRVVRELARPQADLVEEVGVIVGGVVVVSIVDGRAIFGTNAKSFVA